MAGRHFASKDVKKGKRIKNKKAEKNLQNIKTVQNSGEETSKSSKNKKRTKRKNNVVFTVVIVLLLCVMAFSGYKVVTILLNYHEGNSAYNEIAKNAVVSGSIGRPVSNETTSNAESEFVEENDTGITVDFDALNEINSDVIGWLYSEGTVINYPIVRGSDNSYYLNHRFDGVYSSFGTLFADYRDSSDFSTNQTTIYGHNMNNGSMLASLLKYRKQSYYDEHPTMQLFTPDKQYTVEIVSGYIAATSDWCYQRNYSDEEYGSYLDYIVSQSCFVSNSTVTTEDRIILLSTCAYDFNDARFVVIGKLVETAEE